MTRVAVIGTGYIGPIHIEALSRVSGVSVVAVVDTNMDLAKRTADRFDVEKVFDDYHAVLDDPEIDVIHNCTPNKFHYPISKAAMEHGKHVLSEKPLAMNVGQARELVEIAASCGVVNGVNFCYRYFPLVQEMAVRVRRGDMGAVRMAAGTYFQDWLSRPTDFTWRLLKSEAGDSNIAADLGSHWFDLVQFTTGLTVTDVMADFANLIPIRQKPSRQVLAFEETGDEADEQFRPELEDYASVMFNLSNGARGSFTTSQVCPGRKSDTEFQLYGENCSYAWNHKHSTEMWIGHRERANEIFIENPALQDPSTARYASLPAGHPTGYHDAEVNLMRDFYDAVNGNESAAVSRPTFETGFEEMRIVDALVRSNRERCWIMVGE